MVGPPGVRPESVAQARNRPMPSKRVRRRLRSANRGRRGHYKTPSWTQAGHECRDRGRPDFFFLDGHIRLQLMLEATITGGQDGVADIELRPRLMAPLMAP